MLCLRPGWLSITVGISKGYVQVQIPLKEVTLSISAHGVFLKGAQEVQGQFSVSWADDLSDPCARCVAAWALQTFELSDQMLLAQGYNPVILRSSVLGPRDITLLGSTEVTGV